MPRFFASIVINLSDGFTDHIDYHDGFPFAFPPAIGRLTW